jgi:hypothetical protein
MIKETNKYSVSVCIISEEHHKTQTLASGHHFHIFIKLDKALRIRTNTVGNWWSSICGQRVNVQFVKSQLAVVKYITKEDRDPLCYPSEVHKKILAGRGSAKACLFKTVSEAKEKGTPAQIVAACIQDGQDPLDLLEGNPSLWNHVVHNLAKLQHAQMAIQAKRVVPPYNMISFRRHPTLSNAPSEKIIEWVNLRMKMQEVDPVYPKLVSSTRLPTLWIVGSTGLGKTTFTQMLAQSYNVYVGNNEKFYNGISSRTELFLWDEFDGALKLGEILKMLDNTVQTWPIKNGAAVRTLGIPMIFATNKHPREYWPRPVNSNLQDSYDIQIDALFARLTVVDFRQYDIINNCSGTKIQYHVRRSFNEKSTEEARKYVVPSPKGLLHPLDVEAIDIEIEK